MIGEVSRMPLDKGQAVRIRLTRPQVYSLTSEEVGKETNWLLTLADKMQTTPQPLMSRATSPIPRSPTSRSPSPIPACCTGSSIPMPATR